MLSAVLVALTLEGTLPGLARMRRPVPVVRYERLLEARWRANLRRIARRLTRHEPAEAAVVYTDCRSADSCSHGTGTGARTVLFRVR